jgi:hypothetical protein
MKLQHLRITFKIGWRGCALSAGGCLPYTASSVKLPSPKKQKASSHSLVWPWQLTRKRLYQVGAYYLDRDSCSVHNMTRILRITSQPFCHCTKSGYAWAVQVSE